MALRSLAEHDEQLRFEGGKYDLRNWPVRGAGEERAIGKIDDILVEEDGGRRYICVALDGSDRHVLVPARHAEADENAATVVLHGITRSELESIPPYAHAAASIDAAYERRLLQAYEPRGAEPRERPAAPEAPAAGELVSIDRAEGLEIVPGDPDPRGWVCVGGDGRALGRIEDLLVDEAAMEVRQLAMRPDEYLEEGRVGGERRLVLIPVDEAELDERQKRVRVRSLDASRISSLDAGEKKSGTAP